MVRGSGVNALQFGTFKEFQWEGLFKVNQSVHVCLELPRD